VKDNGCSLFAGALLRSPAAATECCSDYGTFALARPVVCVARFALMPTAGTLLLVVRFVAFYDYVRLYISTTFEARRLEVAFTKAGEDIRASPAMKPTNADPVLVEYENATKRMSVFLHLYKRQFVANGATALAGRRGLGIPPRIRLACATRELKFSCVETLLCRFISRHNKLCLLVRKAVVRTGKLAVVVWRAFRVSASGGSQRRRKRREFSTKKANVD
jgi:hypothetical protein